MTAQKTITAKTPTGTEYTVRATGELFRGLETRMRFEVTVPEKGVRFVGTYSAGQDALTGTAEVVGKRQSVAVKVTEAVRAFIEDCEKPMREAEAAEEARIGAIADGIRRIGFSEVESADGLYGYHSAHDGYVAVDSEISGLSDTTSGKVGKHIVYLQYARERGVDAELLAGARDFSRAVRVFEQREEAAERDEAARREIERGEEIRRSFEAARAKTKESGARVELRRYSTGCNDRDEECSTDIVTEWAMPDGTTETTRMHTW